MQKFYHYATNHRSFEKALSCSWVVKKALLHFEPSVHPPEKNGARGNPEVICGLDTYIGRELYP